MKVFTKFASVHLFILRAVYELRCVLVVVGVVVVEVVVVVYSSKILSKKYWERMIVHICQQPEKYLLWRAMAAKIVFKQRQAGKLLPKFEHAEV